MKLVDEPAQLAREVQGELDAAGTSPAGLASAWRLLRGDPMFARYQGCQFLLGVSNMMIEAPLIYLVSRELQASYTTSIALTLAIPVLLLHDRWRREGWRPGAWLGPLVLGVALLAGESALAIGAYLAAYALHLDRGGAGDTGATGTPSYVFVNVSAAV